MLRHHSSLTCRLEQVQRLQKNGSVEHHFSIVWVPRRTLVSDKILEESGVLGDLSVEVLSLYFVPLDQDILSLCFEDAFSDLYLVSKALIVTGVWLIIHSEKIQQAYFSLLKR